MQHQPQSQHSTPSSIIPSGTYSSSAVVINGGGQRALSWISGNGNSTNVLPSSLPPLIDTLVSALSTLANTTTTTTITDITSLNGAIARIRAEFEHEYAINEDLYHPIDVERVRTESWQVHRYLLAYDCNEQDAFVALCRALQWKKSFGIHALTDQYFPREYWHLYRVELCGRDYNGRLVQWMTMKNRLLVKDLYFEKQFFAHCLERADRAAGRDGFIFVFDCTNATTINIDLDLLQFELTILEHYPWELKMVYLIDLPTILHPVAQSLVANSLRPKWQDRVQIISRYVLPTLMDVCYIPVSLGGVRQTPNFPPATIPLDQCSYMDAKFVEAFYSTFNLKRSHK